MRRIRILLSIAVSALLQNVILGWISQPDTYSYFHTGFRSKRRSSLSFQSPMAPMDFIDVEITGHAKESESSDNTDSTNKRESKIKEEDKARTKEILMPSISPTMTKGKIVEWLVRTGDTIRKGDPIMVIESEKEIQGARGYRMNQDVHANVDGVLAAIYQQPGQAVDVGAVLGVIVPDFIIDVEIEGQVTATDATDKSEEEETTGTTATAAETSDQAEPVVTTTKMNDAGAGPTIINTEQEKQAGKAPSMPSMMDEIMPQTQNMPSVNLTPDTAGPGSTADWVHQHHATTDGMVNDSSFYSAHTNQGGAVRGGGGGGGPSPNKSRFDIGIDSTDPFYSPYDAAGGSGFGGPGVGVGAGPGYVPPHSPPPPPPHSPYAAGGQGGQPGPSMKPNGANDNFYEAYQGDKRPDDPYVQQMKNWKQSTGGVGNSNMGDYYKAERNGQSGGVRINNNPSSSASRSAGPGADYLHNNNNGGAYTGYDIPKSPKIVNNPTTTEQPQGVFVNGVSPQGEVDPQDGYSSGFVRPTTTSTTTSTSPNEPFGGSSSPSSSSFSTTTSTTTATTTATTANANAVQSPPTADTTTTTAAATSTPPAASVVPPPSQPTPPVVETPPAEAAATVVPPPSPVVEPPIIATDDNDNDDDQAQQQQVGVMESRIANLEESLRTHTSQDSFKTSIQAELDCLKKELLDIKTSYDGKVKTLEESYQTSLSQVGRDFTKSMEELRDWDTLTVTWDIKDFEKTLQQDLTTYTSEEFNVAGYSMTLEMQIFGTNDEGTRDVGFYIMHTGGLNYVPIMIGGSKIIIQSTSTGAGNEDAVKVFVDDASIEDSHYGWGWKKFFSLQDLKQSFVNSKGEIQVTASVRVKRVKNCRINTAI
mmetsp:Transcript_36030/g.87076  ORF Transcript_36030/g.87076 Transcript_36030/m.87076 type:complete len:873 (+) Transcript_36030:107-2725(+)